MDRPFRPFQTGSDADIAFAVVVLAAYFSTFSVMQSASTLELLMMIALGIAYIVVGIYGYSFALRSGQFLVYLMYFAVQLILGGMIIYLSGGIGFNAMVLLPLAGHSVVLLPSRWRLAINVGIVLTYVCAVDLLVQDWSLMWSGLPMFLAGQIFIVVFTQMAVSEERARAEVEQLVKELEEANQRLREYALQIEELAIAKERNRLAREIHDGIGHYLTTIYMQIQAARAVMKTDPTKAHEALGTAQNQTREALNDIRQSVASLRDMPGVNASLSSEIETMLKRYEGSGLTTELKSLGSPRPLPPQTTLTMFRVVQEGINNTVKHAQANHLTVTLDYTQADRVRLMLQDDGVGAESLNGGGFGLLGMRERVSMLNGSLDVSTAPGDGFRLDICIPG